jgi:predicted Zn-dependent protease with MMP-like domain
MTPAERSKAAVPTLEDFERLAEAAFADLPKRFRDRCDDVIIRIEDFPDRETLRRMQCRSPYDLLGLFRGRGLVQRGATAQTGQFPNMIWLYRRPILAFWAAGEDSLEAIVAHVLIHEIGHHFGFSDADMAAIERAAD